MNNEPVTLTIPSAIHGTRTWRRVATRDHVTRDGRQVTIADWESTCVMCGEPFIVTTPGAVVAIEQSWSFQGTTCPAHRMTPSEIGKLRATKARNRPAVFEAIKRNKLAAG